MLVPSDSRARNDVRDAASRSRDLVVDGRLRDLALFTCWVGRVYADIVERESD